MSLAVAVVNWNSGAWLRTCIESVMAHAAEAEIVVVDNASADASMKSVEEFGNRLRFIRNKSNLGFAAAVNQAFRATSSLYVLLLNPDIRVMPGSIRLLQDFMSMHSRAAAAGGYVNEKYFPRAFPTAGKLIRENLGLRYAMTDRTVYDRPTSLGICVDQPAAAALMVRRDAYDEVGGFDEQFYPAWYEDVDFCQRVKRKGWELYFLPSAKFEHEGGYSTAALGAEKFLQAYYGNQIRYVRKHFGRAATAAVRASIATGLFCRMLGKPNEAKAYAKSLFKMLAGS